MRVWTNDNKCHKSCCYHKHCKGFRTREKRCPQWSLDKDGMTFDQYMDKYGHSSINHPG